MGLMGDEVQCALGGNEQLQPLSKAAGQAKEVLMSVRDGKDCTACHLGT